MLSSSRDVRAQRRQWMAAAVLVAQGMATPVWLVAAEAGLRPAGRSIFSRMTSEAELPPIVAPSAAQRPRPNQPKAMPPKEAEQAAAPTRATSQPTSRLARMQAAAAEMLGTATEASGTQSSPRPQSNPWMQEIDPAIRSKPVTRSAPPAESEVEPVRYHARLEDKVATLVRVQTDDSEADADPATTVAPVISEPTEEETTSQPESPAARSGIGKPASLFGRQLPRMLGLQQVSGGSSRRTYQQPAKEAAAHAEPAPDAASPAPEEAALAECRRLEEKLCELFPDREIQIVIGRDHASKVDAETEIIAIIRKPQQHNTSQPAVEATSVLKAPGSGSRYFAR
jgi:hypothetical protein